MENMLRRGIVLTVLMLWANVFAIDDAWPCVVCDAELAMMIAARKAASRSSVISHPAIRHARNAPDKKKIDKDIEKKMSGALFSDGSWEYKVVDWEFSSGQTRGSRFDTSITCEGHKKGGDACDSLDTSDQNKNTPEESGVFESVKNALYNVKVSKYDATALERQLRGELFDIWKEKCEVMKTTRVRVKDLKDYLDYIADSYEGIDEAMRKKMNGIFFSDGIWEHKVVEWSFTAGASSGSRYGMIALGKSPDGKYVDAMFVMYKMDFKIAPRVIVTKEEHSFLIFFKTTSTKRHTEEVKLDSKSIKRLQNFFRFKALEGFYNEGIIDKINFTASLDEVPEIETIV